jgi:hypothetical protein
LAAGQQARVCVDLIANVASYDLGYFSLLVEHFCLKLNYFIFKMKPRLFFSFALVAIFQRSFGCFKN